MRLFIFAAVAVGALLVAAGSAEAQCYGGARGFYGVRNVGVGGAPVVRGRNGFFSAGGRRAVFTGTFDRFGNPVFR